MKDIKDISLEEVKDISVTFVNWTPRGIAYIEKRDFSPDSKQILKAFRLFRNMQSAMMEIKLKDDKDGRERKKFS